MVVSHAEGQHAHHSLAVIAGWVTNRLLVVARNLLPGQVSAGLCCQTTRPEGARDRRWK